VIASHTMEGENHSKGWEDQERTGVTQ